MAVTIRDVARDSGVSFQLVAAVLGGKKYAHASEVTRKKIFAAAERLGYIPNVSARILRGNASKVLGVLIDSRAPELMYSILAEIEQEASSLGYRLLVAQAHDKPEKLLDSCRALRQNGVDGIISFSHDYAPLDCHLDVFLKKEKKIVFVLNTDEKLNSAVDVDICSGMRDAVEHLRASGYRNPALLLNGVSPEKLPMSCRKRQMGFMRVCPRGEVFTLPPSCLEIPRLEKECRKFIKEKIMPGKIDSIVAINDLLAVILINQLTAAGIQVPRDFGVIGWDDLPIGMCHPVKLTTLHYDRKKLARTILKILLDKIAGKTDPVRITLPLKLIPRESTKKGMRYEV